MPNPEERTLDIPEGLSKQAVSVVRINSVCFSNFSLKISVANVNKSAENKKKRFLWCYNGCALTSCTAWLKLDIYLFM